MSSDIPRARSILATVLREFEIDIYARKGIRLALSLMTRASPVRRAPSRRKRITDAQKTKVKSLRQSTLTYHEIANRLDIANSGRVSEIMTGKRK